MDVKMNGRYIVRSITKIIFLSAAVLTCVCFIIYLETKRYVTVHVNAMPVTQELQIVTSSTGRRTSLLKRSENYVVPNVVHFVWFGQYKKFEFHHFLSVKSAAIKIKPTMLNFHCDFEPIGDLWKSLKNEIKITVIKTKAPEHIYGKRLRRPEHKSDIARMDILLKHGGIYLDTDVIALRSFDTLRHYDVTMGLEYHGNPGRLNNGVIIAKANASFLHIWRETYRNFSSTEWDYHDCIIPYNLQFQYPELIHVEERSINYPSGPNRKLIYENVYDWSKNYAVHLWYRLYGFQHGPGAIKSMNTTFGQIARLIYYNTTALLK